MEHGMRGSIRIIAAAALGLAAVACAGDAARAASGSSAPTDVSAQQQQRRVPRITVVPLSRYYRKCDFWLALEHRPSGDVLTPQQHCWWALR
jgi:hypothetical protein